MKSLFWITGFLITLSSLCAEPLILPHGIQNAASYEFASFEGLGMAPGSIFVIKGSGLGPETLVESDGGTDVRVRSIDTGVETNVPILYSWGWQVAAILPDDFPLGPAELILTYAGETATPIAFTAVEAAPGLFTVAQNGRGPGVIQNFEPGRYSLNGLTRPARPGQYIILWGTGLGRLSKSDYDVHIGEVRLTPEYAGPAPGYPGLDQINVRLPDDGSIPDGCYVNLSLRAGDAISHPITVSTARQAEQCSHPWDLSPDLLARLDEGETLPWARLSVFTPGYYAPAQEHDEFHAELRHLLPWEVATHSRAPHSGDFFLPGPSGACFGGTGETASARLGGVPTPGYPSPER